MVAKLSTPDLTPVYFPGLVYPAELGDFGFVLYRNGLVLALHGFACVAGFMAGSSLPQVAEGYSGVWRWIHDKAGPLAIGFVIAATLFSLTTQAWALGSAASTLSAQLDMPPSLLLLTLSIHAVPELFALFLPLAAWTIASRRKQWNELLGGDVRDGRDRDPDHHRRRGGGDVGDSAFAGRTCRLGRGYTF